MKDFLKVSQLDGSEIRILSDLNDEMKRRAESKYKRAAYMAGRTMLCISEGDACFTAPALAFQYLGGNVVTVNNCADILDYLRKADNYGISLVALSASQIVADKAAEAAGRRVINAGSDEFNPFETLSALFTLRFCFDSLENKNITFLGHRRRAMAGELAQILREEKANVFPFLPPEKSGFYPESIPVFTRIELALAQSDAIIDLGVNGKEEYEDYYSDPSGLSEELLAKTKANIPILGARYINAEGRKKEYPLSQIDREQKNYLGAWMAVLYYFFR